MIEPPLTDLELEQERAHRILESLAIQCGTANPTRSQLATAKSEAQAVLRVLRAQQTISR